MEVRADEYLLQIFHIFCKGKTGILPLRIEVSPELFQEYHDNLPVIYREVPEDVQKQEDEHKLKFKTATLVKRDDLKGIQVRIYDRKTSSL